MAPTASLSKEQLAGIEAVAMDMWDPVIASTVAHVPGGRSKIVFDRFHAVKLMTDAVDRARKAEHRRLQAEGDETLKRTSTCGCIRSRTCPSRRGSGSRRCARCT